MRGLLEAYIKDQISENNSSEFYNGKASIEFKYKEPFGDDRSFYEFLVNGREIGHLTIFDATCKNLPDDSFHFTFKSNLRS